MSSSVIGGGNPDSSGDMDILNEESGPDADLLSKETPDPESTGEELDTKATDDEPKDEKEATEDPEVDDDKIIGRVTFKEVTAEFPELFKKFPSLRDSFFREQEYSKVFATVEEARISSEKAQVLDNLDQSVVQEGNPAPLMEVLFNNDPKAAKNFAKNFLPTIFEADKQTYVEITTPIIKNVLRDMLRLGIERKDKNIELAAGYASQVIFGSFKIPEDAKETVDPKLQELQGQIDSIAEEKEYNFNISLAEAIEVQLKRNIKLPEDMPEYQKEALVEKIIKDIGSNLARNPDHVRSMKALMQAAKQGKYGPEWKPRLVAAFLGRAKNLLPAIKQKALAGGSSDKPTGKNNKPLPPTARVGKEGSKIPNDPKKVDWKKTSDMDILNG